ncbi:hypothetical protein PPERSA_08747 [Pseudocohnilembus persalinus]|uniref:Uncharacterized protein n=1 Tax=Pseudocohnilembus persalinus TaxID=266149 RepID=A0A0V0R7F8_PSEPJ|nr:hypothetical protein PPERSA_08747 [Pseudocohnilembus persalinus]|eukprot:KRX10445.1 hypothetical protein PPERSA_08747 [Pseudocohnilembus persalinus]
MSVIDEVEKNTVDLENSEKSIQQNQNKELVQPNTNVTKSQEKQQLLKSPAQNTLHTIKEEDLNQSVVTRPKKNSIASLIDNITENNKNIAENYENNSGQNQSQNLEDNIVSQFSNKLQVSPDLNDMNFSSKYSLFEKRSHFIDFKKPPPSPQKKNFDQIQKSKKNSLQIQDYYHLPAGRKNQNMNLSSSQNNQMNRSSIEIQEISRASSHSFVEEQKVPDKTQSKYKKISCRLKKFNKKYKKLTHKYQKILKINEKISQELTQHIKNLEKFQQFQELQKDPEFQQLLSDYQQQKQQSCDKNQEKQSSFLLKQNNEIQSQNNEQQEKQISKNKLQLNKSNLKISDFNFPDELNYPKIPLITQDSEFNDFQELLILDQENQEEQVQNDNYNQNYGFQTNNNYLDTQDEVIQGPETIKKKLDLQSYSLSQSPKEEEESNKSSQNKQISPNSKYYIRQNQEMRLQSDNSPSLTYSTFTPKYYIKQENFSKFSLLQNQINQKQKNLFTRQKTLENNSSIKNRQTFNLKNNQSNLINPKKEEKNSPFNDSQPQSQPQARKKKKKLTTFSSKVEIFNLESENQEQKLRETSQSGQNTTAFVLNNNSNLTQQTNIYPFTPKTFNISQLTSLSSEDFNTNSLSKKGLLGENQNKQYFRFQENLNKNGQNFENNIQFTYQLNEHLEENEENSVDTSQDLNKKNGEQKNLKKENLNKEIFLNSETLSIYSENQEIQLQKKIIENSHKNEKIKEDQNQ